MITHKHFGEIYDIVERATEHGGHLNEFERSFIEDWNARLDRDGERVTISDKQQWVFDGIARKLDVLDPPAEARGDDAGDRPRDLNEVNLREEVGGGGPGGPAEPGPVDRP